MVDPAGPGEPSPSSRLPRDTKLGGMDGKELRDRAGVAARALHDDPLFTHLALPAYLETSNPKNLAWYRRFGFEIERELRVGAAKPAIWTMRRLARG